MTERLLIEAPSDAQLPAWTVELSWRENGVYEVEAADEDAAISAAILKARRDSVNDPQHFDVEMVVREDESA